MKNINAKKPKMPVLTKISRYWLCAWFIPAVGLFEKVRIACIFFNLISSAKDLLKLFKPIPLAIFFLIKIIDPFQIFILGTILSECLQWYSLPSVI